MTAGEVYNPRKMLPKVLKAVIVRLFIFFILGGLAAGIVCPSNSEYLLQGDFPGAGQSSYVISMIILNINGLPDLVNTMVLTTVYPSGHGFFYCMTRALYGMAREGHVRKILRWCLSSGSPVGSITVVPAIGCLSVLKMDSSSATVLT